MPEEVNRVLTDHISSLLFCPTATAVGNLEREGIREGVHVTGDVMVDALEFNRVLAAERSTVLDRLDLTPGGYLVLTIHRASNTDDPAVLRAILEAVGEADLPVVFPVHPRTRHAIAAHGLELPANVLAVEPLGYFDMLRLLESAHRLLTDSGGMQKEAYVLGVPCVTLRDTTEWVETVALGWNVLAGTDRDAILEGIRRPLPAGQRPPVYGDGRAERGDRAGDHEVYRESSNLTGADSTSFTLSVERSLARDGLRPNCRTTYTATGFIHLCPWNSRFE